MFWENPQLVWRLPVACFGSPSVFLEVLSACLVVTAACFGSTPSVFGGYPETSLKGARNAWGVLAAYFVDTYGMFWGTRGRSGGYLISG